MDMPEPQSSGNGFPAFKFKNVGDKIAGEITDDPKQVSTKALDPGKPDVENIVFELHTDAPVTSTGKTGEVIESQDWTIWVPIRSQRYTALYEAVIASGGKLSKGGRVGLLLASLEDTGKPSPMKVFAIGYKAPAVAASTADGAPSVADLLG